MTPRPGSPSTAQRTSMSRGRAAPPGEVHSRRSSGQGTSSRRCWTRAALSGGAHSSTAAARRMMPGRTSPSTRGTFIYRGHTMERVDAGDRLRGQAAPERRRRHVAQRRRNLEGGNGPRHHLEDGRDGVQGQDRHSSNGGAGWTTIVPSTANAGSYAWTVPGIASANGLVRVKESTTGTPADTSDETFSVVLARPLISLSRTALSFGAPLGGTATPNQQVVISNADAGTLSWTATPSAAWITATPGAGRTAGRSRSA